MTFSTYLSSRRDLIEKTLESLISQKEGLPHSTLFEAARYSLLGKAKRLRPLLALVTAEAFGARVEDCLQSVCALELLHTYSLIHDDLPCMDDDDMRRGRPTSHKVFGEAVAVLSGDYLLTYAFEVIATCQNITAEQKVELIKVLSQKSGSEGMVGGQLIDILNEGKKIDWATLEFIHRYKTAALISASLEFGAILADASKEDREKLQSIGNAAGISFQIIDDILDVTSSEKELGKPVFSDQANAKCTAVTLLGIEKAQQTAQALMLSVKNDCKDLSISSTTIEEMLQKLLDRNF